MQQYLSRLRLMNMPTLQFLLCSISHFFTVTVKIAQGDVIVLDNLVLLTAFVLKSKTPAERALRNNLKN